MPSDTQNISCITVTNNTRETPRLNLRLKNIGKKNVILRYLVLQGGKQVGDTFPTWSDRTRILHNILQQYSTTTVQYNILTIPFSISIQYLPFSFPYNLRTISLLHFPTTYPPFPYNIPTISLRHTYNFPSIPIPFPPSIPTMEPRP